MSGDSEPPSSNRCAIHEAIAARQGMASREAVEPVPTSPWPARVIFSWSSNHKFRHSASRDAARASPWPEPALWSEEGRSVDAWPLALAESSSIVTLACVQGHDCFGDVVTDLHVGLLLCRSHHRQTLPCANGLGLVVLSPHGTGLHHFNHRQPRSDVVKLGGRRGRTR